MKYKACEDVKVIDKHKRACESKSVINNNPWGKKRREEGVWAFIDQSEFKLLFF
jgi:hypothetical protein